MVRPSPNLKGCGPASGLCSHFRTLHVRSHAQERCGQGCTPQRFLRTQAFGVGALGQTAGSPPGHRHHCRSLLWPSQITTIPAAGSNAVYHPAVPQVRSPTRLSLGADRCREKSGPRWSGRGDFGGRPCSERHSQGPTFRARFPACVSLRGGAEDTHTHTFWEVSMSPWGKSRQRRSQRPRHRGGEAASAGAMPQRPASRTHAGPGPDANYVYF